MGYLLAALAGGFLLFNSVATPNRAERKVESALRKQFPGAAVDVEIEGSQVAVKPRRDDRRSRTMWGTTRSLINGMVTGVSTGFTKSMEITGTGYRAAVQGKDLVLSLGFSHEVKYPIPTGITIVCERPTAIKVSGADKRQVGQVAAEIRAYRGPEPYKGKGVRYDNEVILRKEGKKK